jgi:NAD(P)-dependent dehydrogenase (short-subunit alcohol dehydrogenase family)
MTNWLITGASRGLGRAFATAALERGDRVAATVRDTAALDELSARHGDRLIPVQLDVTEETAARATVREAAVRLGRVDVVVNNAGYGHFGAVEELSTQEVQAQLAANFYGPLWISQAALPVMRAQGGGRIVQISSLGGIGAFANLGAYHASKWALEAFSESMAVEVAGAGISVTIVEPGGYETDWSGPSATRSAPLPPYDEMRAAAAARRGGSASGSPDAAARALLAIVDAEEPPRRVVLGAQALEVARGILEQRLADWEQWSVVSESA